MGDIHYIHYIIDVVLGLASMGVGYYVGRSDTRRPPKKKNDK